MNLPDSYFCDFLLRNEYVNLEDLQTALPAKVAPYVVIAHIIGIVLTNAFGIDVKVRDQTRTSVFALRGDFAYHFYEEHLRTHDDHDVNSDSFALDASWFGTYLFQMDSTRRIITNGQHGFIVSQICMKKEIIDQFVLYIMDEEEYQSYREVIAVALPSGPGYPTDGLDISLNRPGCVGLGIGFRKRIYTPYMP